MTKKSKFVLGRVENIVGKGENAGYQHFLLFQQRFEKPAFPGLLKVGIVVLHVTVKNQSDESTGVAFVKGAHVRNS